MVSRSAYRTLHVMMLASAALIVWVIPARSNPPLNDYPTAARVTYVQDCMGRNRGGLADLYKCSCVIDWLAQHLTYDQFVEASTFAHYSALPGEGGGIFRDTAHAKDSAKLFRNLEAAAYHACGLKQPPS